MSTAWLKRLVVRLPHSAQQEIRRLQCGWQLRTGRFHSSELEYACLRRLVGRGDWVIDVGANVGHYTSRLSELVGPDGRVIAFEPFPATFEILAANSRHFAYRNTTLVNAAVSDHECAAGMEVPDWSYGGPNYYRAHLSEPGGGIEVLCWTLDSFPLPHRVALIKIDVEGVAQAALRGAGSLIERDSPLLIVEGEPGDFLPLLNRQGYRAWRYAGSPNVLLASNWQGFKGGPELAEGCELPDGPGWVPPRQRTAAGGDF